MDSSAIKLLLEAQERAYNSALNMVVKQLNDQINKLEQKVSDLTTSLEYTQKEVDDLKANVKEHEKEKKEDKMKTDKLIQQIETSKLQVHELEEKVTYQEDYSRRKNLRISGLNERGDETWEQTAAAVTSLLETKLQLPGVVLERAHRVGPRRDDRPRTVVARFARYGDRDAAIRRGSHLKGTNIYLNEDLSSASLATKKAQIPLFKQARAEGKIAFFRHTKLIIRERTNGGAAGLGGRQAARVAGAAGGGPRGDLVPLTAAAGTGVAADDAEAAASAVGGPGAADGTGGVVRVEAEGTASGGSRGDSVPLAAAAGPVVAADGVAGAGVAADDAGDTACAVGGAGAAKGAGAADGAGGVVRVEAAGAWTTPLATQRTGGSRLSSASPAASPPQRKDTKKILRSNTKK